MKDHAVDHDDLLEAAFKKLYPSATEVMIGANDEDLVTVFVFLSSGEDLNFTEHSEPRWPMHFRLDDDPSIIINTGVMEIQPFL